jgi:adenylate cyclase
MLTAFFFFDNGIMLNLLYPPLAVVGTFVGMNLYNVACERSKKMEITRTFGRYVSTPVADKILAALEEDGLKLGGDQRIVTVAFADIRGFSSLAENTPPDKLVAAVNAYLSAVIDVFLQHDGMINKFGGDGVMAVWNAPTDCPEHALRAATAAVDAQRAVKELEQDPTLPQIKFGIGVNTGRVTAGNFGCKDRMEYSVIGVPVNIAFRLTSVAPGGKVWLGASTYEMVKNHISARAVEPFMVKGSRQPIRAYEIIDTDIEPADRQSEDAVRVGVNSNSAVILARGM